LSEVDVFINAYAVGDEIYNLGVDIKREVAAFATLFIEVAKRSRTPSDVLISQQIGSLHERIVIIHEQLDRLLTLEGVRTEIARLASENYPALPGNLVAQENNCRAFALAQQMRGWFETLGYRLEKYEIWMQDYFEWIINIPVRRNRYDRVLVRGIAGEAGVSDVIALKQSVEQQRTDEGWLITARRVSRAARSEVEKEENNHLGCYTFDELLAQDADFSGYLDWLEAEVKQRKIDTKYIPLACIKEEIDSVTKRSIAISRYEEEDGWIDGYIDRWLDDPAKEHISILGEFGTGKTWFALHYAWLALQRYRDAQRRGVELPRLPLVIPLRDYAKAVSTEAAIRECNLSGSFCRQAIFTNANWDWNYADVIFDETILPNGDIENYNYHPSDAVKSLQKRYDSGERAFTFAPCSLDLTGIRLSGSTLRFSALMESQLLYADLRNCNFEDSNIQRCFFDFADLSGSVFKEAGLADNSFTAVNLSDANFEGAYLFEEDNDHGCSFDGAIFCRTIMPNGSIRNCGC
jgi:uncharacterized protein YjbI with pentapeptide repeats